MNLAPAGPAGPLQAFGHMQRALRDADRRLADLGHSQGALTTTVDGKLDTMARRIQRDGAKLRSETHGLLADLEELTLQMYEEHEAALRTVKSEADALRCENEAQLAQQHAQIQAQQSQIDVLTAQLQQQTALLSEFRTQSGAVMAAMTDELKELRRGFGTQAEALTATKAYVSAAEEKLAAQIEKRVRASELMAAGTAEALTARVDDQQRLFSQTLETQRTQQASYDALLAWKTKTDEKAAAAADERAALAAEARGAKEAAAEAEASMRRELNEVAAPWPTLLGEMRDELAKMEGKKADAAELSERADGLGDRVGALERQVCEQLGPEVATVGATVAQIRASEEEEGDRRRKAAQQLADLGRAAQQLAAELNEARSLARGNQQQLAALAAKESDLTALVGTMEAKLRHVAGLADEQGRYLSQVSEKLFADKAVKQRYRTGAIVPSFAPPSQYENDGFDARAAAAHHSATPRLDRAWDTPEHRWDGATPTLPPPIPQLPPTPPAAVGRSDAAAATAAAERARETLAARAQARTPARVPLGLDVPGP